MGSKIIKSKPLFIQAYEQLKADVLNGDLKPGERLTDQQLADWLGISRSPVREAVRILCKEGMLVNNNGVVTVYRPNIQDICEVFLLRASVESLAVSIIAINEDKDRIIDILTNISDKSKEFYNNNNFKAVQEYNTVFHGSLVKLSGFKILEEVYVAIDSKMNMFRSFPFSLKNDSHRKIAIIEHPAIIEAITSGDIMLCKSLVEKHVLSAGKRVIKEFVRLEGITDEKVIKNANKYIDACLKTFV